MIHEYTGKVLIDSPPPASSPETLRFGWSSKTHSPHIGLALQWHPELAEAHGLETLVSFQSGKAQGKAL